MNPWHQGDNIIMPTPGDDEAVNYDLLLEPLEEGEEDIDDDEEL